MRRQRAVYGAPENAADGSMDDGPLVRHTLATSIKTSSRSRAQIAEEISRLTGRRLTEISLNKFTAETRTDYRWPAELDRAFATATGDDSILRCRAEQAGYHVVTSDEYALLELGRQYLTQKRAAQMAAELEKRLAGVDL